MNIPHIPVLLNEVKETFKDINDGYIVDCTVGYGGHSEALLEQNPNIKLICCDQDAEAIAFSKKRLEKFGERVIFEHAKFSTVIEKYLDYPIHGILADIGVSSLQLDKKSRGFGFESDTLDMRMNPENPISAKNVVNEYSQEQLEEILREYGEMRDFKRVAKTIVDNRPFESSRELATVLKKLGGKPKIHPATLPFQAIRIEVNNELGELDELLESIYNSKLKNSLVAIISFHSLEDRIVKKTFKLWTQNCICPAGVMKCECGNNHSLGKVITKKPIIPTKEEEKINPRSRSSKMRVFKLK
ncbi:16S rRNA (cytosine(1402)-N(4))-methyltransferase RsmH [Sulfurospirillum arcachonense]|uniref:16S rRNA (cytosine(1402)-N(4))-methyltransferase RsmH n=1 Tax=Sulfurospirillum arcachonense TaxID=57666 RepID=UPI00046AFA47|nr:16S rRNA (cytosine(1402)-N(4))-methyltransferase RsmH [Sulfurospirillum arcachonense]